mgnify:FL=1
MTLWRSESTHCSSGEGGRSKKGAVTVREPILDEKQRGGQPSPTSLCSKTGAKEGSPRAVASLSSGILAHVEYDCRYSFVSLRFEWYRTRGRERERERERIAS